MDEQTVARGAALQPMDKAEGPLVLPDLDINPALRIERRDEIIIGTGLRLLRPGSRGKANV
jgi:hypothetical protein